MITIRNKYITAQVDTVGAELHSIIFEGEEILASGNFAGVNRVLFPFCGSLKNDGYTFGDEYFYFGEKHGFAKNAEFQIEKQTVSSVTLSLTDSEQTLSIYPFSFKLFVTYTISGAGVLVQYKIKNLSNRAMYCSIGSHEAFKCQGGIENYDISFPWKETLYNRLAENGILTGEKEKVLYNSNLLPLYNRYFERGNSLVFDKIRSRSAVLCNRLTGRQIKIDFPGSENLIIWAVPGEEFVCIQPWAGLPDTTDHNHDITLKRAIRKIRKGRSLRVSHKITVLPDFEVKNEESEPKKPEISE